MIFMMMMMSATPWRKLSVPLTILLMSTSMTEVRLEGEVDEEPGGNVSARSCSPKWPLKA